MFDFPGTPTNGQVVSGPNGSKWQWDGTKWQAANVGGATITIGDVPPASPQAGALWFDSVGAQTYLWYTDPNSSQWTPLNAPPSASIPYLPLGGGTLTGPLTLAADPATAMQASTRQYVDATTSQNVGRNLLHNPQFRIWQRGTGPFTGNYTADRWKIYVNLDTVSISAYAMTDADRTAIGDETAIYALQNVFTGSSSSGAQNQIFQMIEGVRRVSNRPVTVSFWAKAASGTPTVYVQVSQNFGTGGSPSAVAYGPLLPVQISATWARYSVSYTVPSTSGKVLGTNGDDSIQISIFFSAQGQTVQSGTIQVYGAQCEVGSGAGFPTPLAKRDIADEIALCQRFYELINVPSDYRDQPQTISYFHASYRYAVAKRAAPTLTFSGLQYWNTAGQATNLPGPTVYRNNPDDLSIGTSGLGGFCGMCQGTIIASADF